MPERPYKCPLCHSVFKTESGMKWHVAHKHEMPASFDALGKDYEAKMLGLQEDNAQLKQKLDQLKKELQETKMELIAEITAKQQAQGRIQQLNADLRKAMIALAARDSLIKDRLNIELPNPFQ